MLPIKMTILKYFLISATVFYACEGADFLFVSHIARKSHLTLSTKLVTKLANHGHNVTFVTPLPLKKPIKNVNEVHIGSLLDHQPQDKGPTLFELEQINFLQKAQRIMSFQYNFSKYLLEHEKVQGLLHSEQHFDAVIIYQYMNDALYSLAHHFKAPLVLFHPMPLYAPESFLLSHPAPPSYVPNILTDYTGRMNFWQRLKNTFYDSTLILYYLWYTLPKYRELVRDSIPGKLDLYEFYNNASLVLINSHISTNEAIPQVPNVVEIGGFHIEEPKALPEDLKKFLDDATDGVILFSMGSITQSSEFPKDKRDALVKAFSKLKQKVLWKWEDADPPGLSKNVKIMKWMPQTDVLAHPNLRVFISHGGLSSTMESVYHAVPLLGIPVFIDQKMNIALAVSHEYAVQVSYQELTAEKLTDALNEVLNNPKYKTNIKRRSLIMRDRPMKPLDSALYWIEYVVRHDGALHLRYPGTDLNWCQRYLLDVVGFIVIVTVVSVFLITVFLQKILGKKSKSKRKSKKE